MRKTTIAVATMVCAVVLAACGGAAAENSGETAQAGAAAATQPAADAALDETYQNALPVLSQLVLGTLKLEQDDSSGSGQILAIDGEEAGNLLPLWQAYQSLSNSDNTAEAELDALVTQIQDTMRPEQLQAIAAMQLTADNIGEIMQAQSPGGFGGFGERPAGETASGSQPAGGEFAGPPPGAFPGGGPGGSGGAMPGGPGGFAGASPEQQATAIAERMAQDGGDAAAFMTRGMLNQLITSLRLKSGDLTEAELQAQQQQRSIMRWLPMVSEATGIPVEDLNAAFATETTLADVITAKGGDVAAVEAALREALKNMPNADEEAIEEQISDVLNTKVSLAQETR